MKICTTKRELAQALEQLAGSKALVMTMGALHEGHLSLVKAAQEAADHVIVSIYVNPLQFAPGEDYEAYPRDLAADVAQLETVKREGVEESSVEVVYAPTDRDIYPREPLVRINPGPVATVFEGKTRPTHFAGVLQIVHKVFNLVRPDIAFFGQKDAQQLALIRTMVTDLDMPVRIEAVPIKRDADGLALSSRNQYLSGEERAAALELSAALRHGVTAAESGAGAAEVLAAATAHISQASGVTLDYLALVHADTFVPFNAGESGLGLLAVAAWVGSTRLIDNMEVGIG